MKNVRSSLGSLGILNKNSNTQQLILGSVAGYVTGYLTMKVSKKAALAVGGGIIVFQVAQNFGFTKMNWSDATHKAKQMSERVENKLGTRSWKDKAKHFACNNTCFAASFVGGFLIGASCK